MTPTIYIAASSAERPRVHRAQSIAREHGFELAFDWATEIDRVGDPNPADPELARVAAERCIDAVFRADLFWLLLPEQPTVGAWVETWHRTMMQPTRPILMSGPAPDRSVFLHVAVREVYTRDEDVRAFLMAERDVLARRCA